MPRGITLVFLATHWGSKHGGPNALNRNLALATSEVLAKRGLDATVVCVVSEPPNEASARVRLLHNPDFLPPELRDLPQRRSIVIGHDLITGPQALALAHNLGWEALVIMHSSYSEYHARKSKDPATAIDREHEQQQVVANAKHAFGVGPLLTGRLRDMGADNPRTINPGLTVRDVIIPDSRLRVVIHGRLGLEDDAVKQVQLSCAGVCVAIKACEHMGREARDRLKDAELKLIGLAIQDMTHFNKLVRHYAGRSIDIKVFPYIDDHEALIERIKDSNLGLFLSWHEGFGLAAWEAIGLGIPVIISTGMGVYRMLEQVGRSVVRFISAVDITDSGKPDLYGVHSRDRDVVRDAVLGFTADVKERIRDARNLRDILCKSFTWENAATQFLSDLDVLTEVPPRDQDFIVEAIANQERTAVQVLVMTGNYDTAIEKIRERNAEGSLSADFLVVQAQAMLRLGQYADARKAAEEVAANAEKSGSWGLWIDAQGIINTVERDLGQYIKAVATARQMIEVASTREESTKVPSCRRKLARSLALAGSPEAVREAFEALHALRRNEDEDGVSKALLAVGEALRHGGSVSASIGFYEDARDMAQRIGDWDCFLWAVLCLADALLLLDGREKEARLCLKELEGVFEPRTKRFPVEELHVRFSIAILESDPSDSRIDDLVGEYKNFGITWPSSYINLWRQGERQPKRF